MNTKNLYKQMMKTAFLGLAPLMSKDDFERVKSDIENMQKQKYNPINEKNYDFKVLSH